MKVLKSFRDYHSAVKNPEELDNSIKTSPLQFSYGNVSYTDYATHYNPEGYIGRKITALPYALLGGVITTTYHLSLAILHGIPNALRGNSQYLRTHIFSIIRDVEEVFGRIVTIFNDKIGTYLVQQSNFHINCYDSYLNPQREPTAPVAPLPLRVTGIRINDRTWSDGVEIFHLEEAQKISLRYFRDMDREAQQEAITKFHLQSNIGVFGGENIFLQKLRDANEQMLDNVNLFDLQLNSATSKIHYALLSDEDFQEITVGNITNASTVQIHFIRDRIGEVNDFEPTQGSDVDFLELPVVHFHRVHGQKLSENIDSIPLPALALVTNSQLREMNLTSVSKEQIQGLFSQSSHRYEVNKTRFALLSTVQVQAILDKLESYQMSLISDEQFAQLVLRDLPDEKLELLISANNTFAERERRFALFSVQTVQAILDKLVNHRLRLISDAQLVQLDLRVLPQEKLSELFSDNTFAERKRRFALLSIQTVQAILDRLDSNRLALISDEQLPQLDLSDLPDEKVNELFSNHPFAERKGRFALLSVQTVQAILDRLDIHRLRLISDAQLVQLNLTHLPQENLNELFGDDTFAEKRRRFALLSPQTVQAILEKLNDLRIVLISDEQLAQLDLRDLSKRKLNQLLKTHDTQEKNKIRFAQLSFETVQAVLEKLEDNRLLLISDDQLVNLDLNAVPKNILRKLFSFNKYHVEERRRLRLLTSEQKEIVKGKLIKK